LYSRAMQLQYDGIVSVSFPDDELIAALQNLTYANFTSAIAPMTAQYFMNGVVVGNILGNDSIALVSDIVDALNYKAATQASLLTEEIINLTGQALVYRELSSQNNSDDNCILNYYQDGPRNQKKLHIVESVEFGA